MFMRDAKQKSFEDVGGSRLIAVEGQNLLVSFALTSRDQMAAYQAYKC